MKNLFLITTALICLTIGYVVGKTTSAPKNVGTKKVTGIGGIFFKCKDPKTLKEWYAKNLGLAINKYGSNFEWRQADDSSRKGFTLWAPFKETTTYFQPSEKDFMINYRVADIKSLVAELKKAGVAITDTIEDYGYGKFVHIMDPEGNKIELWEPEDIAYEKAGDGPTTH